MLNWLGQMPDGGAVLAEAGGHWHDYGKQPRAGRKVGHATLRADSRKELADASQRVGEALGLQGQVGFAIGKVAICCGVTGSPPQPISPPHTGSAFTTLRNINRFIRCWLIVIHCGL